MLALAKQATQKNRTVESAVINQLAKQWQTERKKLESKVAASEQKLAAQTQAWKKSDADWRLKVEQAGKKTQIKGVQEAITQTSQLTKEWEAESEQFLALTKRWQTERKNLQAQIANSQQELAIQKKTWEKKEKKDSLAQASSIQSNLTTEHKKQLTQLSSEANQQARAWEKERKLFQKRAKKWQTERKELQAQIDLSKQELAAQTKTWQKAVADWRQKAEQAVRNVQIKHAQEAVANTAKLAAEWQTERAVLQTQVQVMSTKLSQLEGQLNVKKFETNQTEILRISLSQKSKALSDLGLDASRLAAQWTTERKESTSELKDMRDLYRATLQDVEQRDKRIEALEKKLAEKIEALSQLATQSEQLSSNWSEQKGGLRKKIAAMEEQISKCEKELAAAIQKHKKLAAEQTKTNKGLSVESQQARTKLKEQVALITNLRQQFDETKTRENKLKEDFLALRTEVDQRKKEAESYQEQKGKEAQALAALQTELEQSRKLHAASEEALAQATEELAAVTQELAEARKEVADYKERTQNLENELTTAKKELSTAQQELAQAHKEAKAHKAAQEKAKEKEAQVRNLEGQLGRLAVTQQELEGNYATSISDLEKLQASYLLLQKNSADGGEATRKAIAERDQARKELSLLKKKNQAIESQVKEVKQRVQAAEKQRKAIEADAEMGKAALGKCETQLTTARRELSELKKGQTELIKEAKALRERFVNIEPVRYELASANVVAQQQRVLAEVKQVLEVYPAAHFAITGHTCNIGSADANLTLSENRAQGLKDFLVTNGIESERFTLIEGCGDTKPQASNETDAGRRQNRRVEIKVVKTK